MNTTLQPFLKPFHLAAHHSYRFLTNDKAIETYHFVWAMMRFA